MKKRVSFGILLLFSPFINLCTEHNYWWAIPTAFGMMYWLIQSTQTFSNISEDVFAFLCLIALGICLVEVCGPEWSIPLFIAATIMAHVLILGYPSIAVNFVSTGLFLTNVALAIVVGRMLGGSL